MPYKDNVWSTIRSAEALSEEIGKPIAQYNVLCTVSAVFLIFSSENVGLTLYV